MAKSNVRIAKKGEVDDVIVDFRDAYYDLLIHITHFMRNTENNCYGHDRDIKEEILDDLSLAIESSLRATPPKDLV